MREFIVYKHTSPSNKVYIGVTSTEPSKRWRNGWGYYNNANFYRAIQKYGWNNFKHEILFEGLTKEEAYIKEIELIALYKSNVFEYGYNQARGGENLGHKKSETTRLKISLANKGRKVSDESRLKMSESKKGRSLSEETKKKLSLKKLGNKSKTGLTLSEETKRKIGEASKNRKRKKWTEEQKQAMSIKIKERMSNPEIRRKLSESAKNRKR